MPASYPNAVGALWSVDEATEMQGFPKLPKPGAVPGPGATPTGSHLKVYKAHGSRSRGHFLAKSPTVKLSTVKLSTVNFAQVSVQMKIMAWGNWCYCSKGMVAFSVLVAVASLASVADAVAHERPAINMAAASAALGSGGGGGGSAPAAPRMTQSAPAAMRQSSPPSHMAPAMMHRPAPMRQGY